MPVTLICQICKKNYQRPPSKAKESSFCSHKCKMDHLQQLAKDRLGEKHHHYKLRSKVKCDCCGKLFGKKGKKLFSKHHYCSTNCRNNHLPEILFQPGKFHPAWKGGSNAYRGPNWRIQRLVALERDLWKCQKCDKYTNVVHHKKPFVFFSHYKEANQLENLESLCQSCHRHEETAFWKGYSGPTPISPYRINEIACIGCGISFDGRLDAKPRGRLRRCVKCRTRSCQWCSKLFLVDWVNSTQKCCSKSCGMLFSFRKDHENGNGARSLSIMQTPSDGLS